MRRKLKKEGVGVGRHSTTPGGTAVVVRGKKEFELKCAVESVIYG